jgi:hypothetical protein
MRYEVKNRKEFQYSLSLEGRGEGPAPRRMQDKALNLTWFRGEGDLGSFYGLMDVKRDGLDSFTLCSGRSTLSDFFLMRRRS